MKSTVIDNTDTKVSRFSFGTASLHHVLGAAKRQRLLNAAYENGITHFDTSPYYGYGISENELGRFRSDKASTITITTKVGLYGPVDSARTTLNIWTYKALGKLYKPYSKPEVDWSVERAEKSLESSLKRIGSDSVDFLFLHEPDIVLLNVDEISEWMEKENERGTVRHWGLAGTKERLLPWLYSSHPLTNILQTRDNLVDKTADFVLEAGRKLQFTSGYFTSHGRSDEGAADDVLLAAILDRNISGSVIVSTRRPERLTVIGQILS